MPGKRLRLFVAIDIPKEVRGVIASAGEEMREMLPGARWVKPENLHLTLKFIGEYREEGLEHLVETIRAAAARCASFQAMLGGCGAFPSRRRARVVWLGMSGGKEGADAVARKLDARLQKAGVEREKRPFRGHITLARLREPADCEGVLEGLSSRLEALSAIHIEVDEITLYRSILGQQGPAYISLQRIALGGGAVEED